MKDNPIKEYSDMDLMLLVDGETDNPSLHRRIQDKADARAKIKALRQIGEVLRTSAELDKDAWFEDGAPSEHMWSCIESKLKLSSEERLDSTRIQISEQAIESTPARSGWSEWFSSWQSHLLIGVAVATASFIIARKTGSPSIEPKIASHDERPNSSVGSMVPVAFKKESQPPEVEHLEIFDGEGMVLTIPGENGDTAVVWVSKNTDVEGPL